MTTATMPTREADRKPRERSLPVRILRGRSTDPAWARPALWAVLLLTLGLYTWNLSANGDANTYYAAAVKSGAESWKAWFFGALDAGSFITVDKPPFALWAMGLSARIFGYSTWSMLLPQVLAGVATVGILYSAVRRPFGHAAATIAALVMALTPITVAINRDNNPDTLLVLLLVAAAWCLQRSLGGRLWPLLGAAVLVGCAFNTKMLQAYLVLPAFSLVYLACARGGVGRRLVNLLLAGVALAASSGWWMGVVALVPAADRPYIGGSTDNTVWDLVIGYNGLGRITGNEGGGPGGGRGGASFGGEAGAGRLFNDIVGGQISWLIPAAALLFLAGLYIVGRAPRTDDRRAALLLWGGWLAVHFVVFGFAEGTFHPYYVTAMAPALGALTGAGAVLTWRLPWVQALTAAVTGAWAFTILHRTPSWHPWVAWTVACATFLAVVLLLVRGYSDGRRGIAAAAIATTLVATLAGPAAYSASAAASRVNGTNPLAGPGSGGMGGPGGRGGPPGGFGGQRPSGTAGQAPTGSGEQPPQGMTGGGSGDGPSGGMGGGGMGGGGMGGPGGNIGSEVVDYLVKNQGSARWLVAVASAQSASSLILQTGRPVIAMGGFTGSDPAMTVAKLKAYAAAGKLRYVLVGDARGGGSSEVTAWVQQNGKAVTGMSGLYELS
ncbi:ArnT family glycosyltransferase [Actinocorallia longicatena]|uniref:Glycosyltransferase family 39 protein n=1 Tax=Actinocorallia longicatena TaxID=111803 RepID=A0ABP6QJZ9_9ACTN